MNIAELFTPEYIPLAAQVCTILYSVVMATRFVATCIKNLNLSWGVWLVILSYLGIVVFVYIYSTPWWVSAVVSITIGVIIDMTRREYKKKIKIVEEHREMYKELLNVSEKLRTYTE